MQRFDLLDEFTAVYVTRGATHRAPDAAAQPRRDRRWLTPVLIVLACAVLIGL
jgi:hypothetical protein